MADSDLAGAPLELQRAASDPASLAAPSETPARPSLLWPGALMQQIQSQMRWGPDQPGTKLP